MPWIRPQNRSPVTALSPWQPSGALGEKEECMHASNWGRYLNIVKLHDHSRQKLADFAFGNEVGDRKKGAGYLRPAHPHERGSSPASWGCLKWDSEREMNRDLPDAEISPMPSVPQNAATLRELSDPKAWVLNVVIFSFCANSGKPCTFLYVFVFLFEYVMFRWNININIWLTHS